MRRPPNQKTSPRTLALPGFVVSGLSKMQGLRGSVISFERVQMGPYPRSPLWVLQTGSFEVSQSNVEGVRFGRSFSRIENWERSPARQLPCDLDSLGGLHLNAFKWQLAPGSLPPYYLAVAPPIVRWLSKRNEAGHSGLPLQHGSLQAPLHQGRDRRRCRGMKQATGRGASSPRALISDSPAPRPLQITRTQSSTERPLMLAPDAMLDAPTSDLHTVVGTPASTAIAISRHICSTHHPVICLRLAPELTISERSRPRSPIALRETRYGDPGRQVASRSFVSTPLCTTADLNTRSGSTESPRRPVPLRAACTARAADTCFHQCKGTFARKAQGPPDAAWPRSKDPSGCLPFDAAPPSPCRAIQHRPSEWPSRRHCTRTSSGAFMGPGFISFERVQMRPRPHPIHPAGRTNAPAETSGHSPIGGTPMHCLK